MNRDELIKAVLEIITQLEGAGLVVVWNDTDLERLEREVISSVNDYLSEGE